MKMEIINIPFELNIKSLAKTGRLEIGTGDAMEFEDLVNKARLVARPKALYKECFVEKKGRDTVTIDKVTFTSRVLRMNLDKVERVFAYVATCGHEVDRIEIPQDNYLKKFWLDTIKAALLGFSIGYLNKLLDRRYKLDKTSHMNPGSGDANIWPIEQQRELFSLFGNVEDLIGVSLTDSCLMIPNKSVSGICFPTEINFQSCQVCHRKKCPSRRAPFDMALWKSVGYRPLSGVKCADNSNG